MQEETKRKSKILDFKISDIKKLLSSKEKESTFDFNKHFDEHLALHMETKIDFALLILSKTGEESYSLKLKGNIENKNNNTQL